MRATVYIHLGSYIGRGYDPAVRFPLHELLRFLRYNPGIHTTRVVRHLRDEDPGRVFV